MNTPEKREAIYADYYAKVQRYIAGKVGNPQEAEDLTGDVFVKIYDRLDSFDETKASVSTWVYTIARNTVIDYYRTRHAHAELPETLAAPDSMETALAARDTLEALAEALEALDERARDIIILRYYRGMKLKEIAGRMDLSYSYTKLLHTAALAQLKKQLNDYID